VIKLYTKLERNRAIHAEIWRISLCDLMTLNIALRVALCSGMIFTKFDLRKLIRERIMEFIDDDTLCHGLTTGLLLLR